MPIRFVKSLLAVFCLTAALPSTTKAQIAIEGLALGRPAPTSLNGQQLRCNPSDDFPGLTRCSHSRPTAGQTSEIYSILHAPEVGVQYLMKLTAPLSLTQSAVQAEIAVLSRRIGRNPEQIQWLPEKTNTKTGVIVRWGGVRFHELDNAGQAEVAAGRSAKQGVLVDVLGDLIKSAKDNSPIFRVTGTKGVVYTASFGQGIRGHRRVVDIDPAEILMRKYHGEMQTILAKDKALKPDDFQLWPEVATQTRRLALDTSITFADAAQDLAFAQHSRKLHSHIWARLPGSVIQGLGAHEYRPGVDHYGKKTRYPDIRANIQAFIRENPNDPFIEFAYYTDGSLDRALAARPNSPVKDVIHYGIGHRIMRQLVREIIAVARQRSKDVPRSFDDSDHRIGFINRTPELFNNEPVANLVPTYAERAKAARPHFLAVLKTPTSTMADDAAYMLGFLARHAGDRDAALGHFEQAMVVGNGDYKEPAAMRASVRLLMTFPAREQARRVEASAVFSKQPAFIYTAARSIYREHNYAFVVEFAERALAKLDISPGRFPATTDPTLIEPALSRLAPQFDDDINMAELPYLLEASRELLQYVDFLKDLSRQKPDIAAKRARAIIIKYSMITDRTEKPARGKKAPELQHKDLRQALHLIRLTLDETRKHAGYGELREWLHYRQARILAVYDPKGLADAITAMQKDAPMSKLLDDAMTELIFAQGIMLKDIGAAERAFKQLTAAYPTANAIDNAHSWMAISYYCADRKTDARRIDREIVRRFPLTRHAQYARARLGGKDDDLPAASSDVCRAEPRFDDDAVVEDTADVED